MTKSFTRTSQVSQFGIAVRRYKAGKQKGLGVSRFGLAVRRSAGKRKDLGSIPLRLSFLFKKVVTLSITSY